MYKIVILTFVLYGCETWSLTLKDEHRLTGLGTGCLGEYLGVREMK
jgi:hypothetical protein